MKTFKFLTLGCKVNQYETQLMREQLLEFGLEEKNSNTPADLYIINTCTVTADADRESRRFIRHSIRENPKATIIAAGCYVEKDADIIKNIDEDIIIISNKEKGDASVFCSILGVSKNIEASPFSITSFKDHTKAFVKIQDGCDNFCSYCKVPYVRGVPKSRPREDILKEVEGLINNGYKEIVLCGICLGAYGKDLGETDGISNILENLHLLEGDFRLRLSSIELQYITDKLLDLMKNSAKICHHLHIPLQSGDNEILAKMNRKYKASEFIEKIEKIRTKIPNIAISTDVIIGFPTETNQAFENTINCIETIKPMRTHIFSYCKRDFTAALNIKPEIDKKIIAGRYRIIKDITDKFALQYEQLSRKIKQRILVETTRDTTTKKLCGYTDTYVRIFFDGPDTLMGKFVIKVL